MLTVIKADKDLCKKANGKGGLLPYQNAYLYDVAEHNVRDIVEFSALLTDLEGRTRHGIIRDEPLSLERGRRTKERFRQVARPWLLLDHDGPAPYGCPDYVQHPEKAYAWMVENHWQFLKGVGVHWQLGNSAGVVPQEVKMSWHLWVLLDRPVLNASRWLESKGFDKSMTNPVQIHYTASPIGVVIPKRSGLVRGGLLCGVTENPVFHRAETVYKRDYKCSEIDLALLDMELESLNGDQGRHGAIRFWIIRAVTVCYPNVEDRAVDKLVSWGRDETTARSEIARLVAWAQTSLEDGSLKPDTSLRPDLAFLNDEEETVLAPVAAQVQAVELGAQSLPVELAGISDNSAKIEWLDKNIKRIAKLSPVELAKVRLNWGAGVRSFDVIVKAYKSELAASKPVGEQVFDAEDWHAVAQSFMSTMEGLVYEDEEWYLWDKTKYKPVDEHYILGKLSSHMMTCAFEGSEGGSMAIKPNRGSLAHAIQQLSFIAGPKAKLEGGWTPFKNGVLINGELKPHDPILFFTYNLNFEYCAEATCPTWTKCVEEWMDGDQERTTLLRQWVKYLLSGRRDLHKIMLMTGVKRGGKGTIFKILQALLGAGNYSAPNMGAFVSPFGLQSSVGKRAIMIPDAHTPKQDKALILERLKTISGNDATDVSRKNKTDLTGVRLGVIVIACNEISSVKDESGALIGRYSILNFKKSFAGKEDTTLEERLYSELSGIYNWAMSCPDFMYFIEGAEEKELKKELTSSSNPVRAWAEEFCTESPFDRCPLDTLHASFAKWSEENNGYSISKISFAKSTRSVFPYSASIQVREGGIRTRYLTGIVLKSCDEDEDDRNDAF